MTSTTTKLINHNFGGIRRKDSMFTDELISCSDCQNVELYYTNLNSGIGIRTAKGNKSIGVDFDTNEYIVNIFETTQLGIKRMIVHTEIKTLGMEKMKLYLVDIYSKQKTLLYDSSTDNRLTEDAITGQSSACDFSQGWRDMFIFSNGKIMLFFYSDTESGAFMVRDTNVTLKDVEGRSVYGLGIVSYDSRLWVFNNKTLWYSQQANCKVFNYVDPSVVTSSGYIELTKPITAIYPYLGSLAVFHRDSSVLVQPDSTTIYKMEEESPGGCASSNSLVFHGTDLYFYDDTKKGVFSFKQIVLGDKTLGENIALNIQEELFDIASGRLNEIRALSVVTSDRNEVWFLIPTNDTNHSIVLIFDYIRGEWVKRKCQRINAICLFNSSLYSGGKDIYTEYVGADFNGEFIPSNYTCSIFNMNEDNTLKITKFPPRITIDGSYVCDFWVKYVRNYNLLKTPKRKRITTKTATGILRYDSDMNYDDNHYYLYENMNLISKLPSSTFKALEIEFYTEEAGQNFCIKSIEFSKLKVKQV